MLDAKRVFDTQKQIGVTFPVEEGGFIEKLVQLEDVAVKLKAEREGVRFHQ